MSDFAPFVAAVLRDKAVDDLLAENQRLRENLDRTRVVEITGPSGTPVYATGAMDQGSYGGGGERWYVDLTQNVPCPLIELGSLEIRLGGVPQLVDNTVRFAKCSTLDFIIGDFDERRRMGLFELDFGDEENEQNVSNLQLRVGPFTSREHYTNVSRHREADHEFLSWNLIEAEGYYPSRFEVLFEDVQFSVPRIQSVLDILDIPKAIDSEEEDATSSVEGNDNLADE